MSRIEELKKQNPNYTIEIIDIINNLFEKVKYTELSVNLIKNKRNSYKRSAENLISELVSEYGQDKKKLESKTYEELINISRALSDYFGYHDFTTMSKFIKLNENNLIQQNDLSKYKSFEELELQVSLAELKMIDKDFEKQIIKLHETNEWLILKPMSFLASKKYGANTKWCTTQENNPDYFLNYSRRGILIYCINKISGEKVGVFKNLDESYDRETSFWNTIDHRIDSMESGLSYDVMEVIKSEFKITTKPNWELLSEDERNKQLMWIDKEYSYNKREVFINSIPMEEPMEELMEEPVRQTLHDGTPRRTRIIAMNTHIVDDIPDEAG